MNPAYNLLTELQLYNQSSFITAEEEDFLKQCTSFFANEPHCFERTTKGHFTGSAWVINHERTHVLLTHHKKLNLWLQLGGHADGDTNIQRVALKEAHEESGTTDIDFLLPAIFDIDIHPIPSACERHYDITYLLQAGKNAKIAVSDESHALAWVAWDDLTSYTNERSVLRKLLKCRAFLDTERSLI